MFYLTLAQQQHIAAHADRTYPEECCGLLLGRIEIPCPADRQASEPVAKTLVEVFPTVNAWTTVAGAELLLAASPSQSRRDRYLIDPRDFLIAQRHARDRQLQIIGVYHSHPDHPAIPSESDRQLAWATYSYLIVSVKQGKMQDLRSWVLDEQGQFQPEAIGFQKT